MLAQLGVFLKMGRVGGAMHAISPFPPPLHSLSLPLLLGLSNFPPTPPLLRGNLPSMGGGINLVPWFVWPPLGTHSVLYTSFLPLSHHVRATPFFSTPLQLKFLF